MRLSENKILSILLLVALLLMSSNVLAQDQSPRDEAPGVEGKSAPAVPDLALIVPLTSALSGRLATLRNQVGGELDIAAIEKNCVELEASLSGLADQLKPLRESKSPSYNKLIELKQSIEKEQQSLTTITRPLGKAISQLGTWRKQWSEEQINWSKWQVSFIEEDKIDDLKSTFVKADRTIGTALDLIVPQLKELLTVQKKAGSVQEKIYTLTVELNSLMLVARRGVLIEASPPMFSSKYFSQFGGDLWHATKAGLSQISWSISGLLDRLGSIVFLQILISLAVIVAIYHNRPILQASVRWRVLGARPISAGVFVGLITSMWFYAYEGIPATWVFAFDIVGAISVARLLGGFLESRWRRHFVYGTLLVWILGHLMFFISLPLPLFRLYTVAVALLAIIFLRRWAKQSQSDKESDFYAWSLRLGSLFFGFVVLAQLAGKGRLAGFLFMASLQSIVEVLAFLLLIRLILGALGYLFYRFLFRHMTRRPHSDAADLVRQVGVLIGLVGLAVLLIPYLLTTWGVYDTFQEGFREFLGFGVSLGSQQIIVGHLIIAVTILYGTFLVSRILQELLVDEVLVRRRMEKGVRLSIARLLHYVLLLLGFLLALWILDFDFTKVVIILSALGVGIGFGLQSIVNNFLSGLILLFERPVRVGDSLEFGGQWVEVKHIGLRATTVETFDRADVIIPNADLVTSPVTNWTLSSRQVRLRLPVGVAYGSDIALVMETLMTCGNKHEKVVSYPSPQVLFLDFGESSLDFELRVWVVDTDERLTVGSELRQEIDQKFREANIEISFPQRDLHLRTVDETLVLPSSESAG